MDEYLKLKNEIDEYFYLEDINENSNVISIFTLYNILNEEFKELRDIFSFKEKINKDLNANNRNNKTEICNSISVDVNNEKSKMNFTFEYNKVANESIILIKERNSDNLYFGYHINREFVSSYYEEIMNHFYYLESLSDIINKSFNCNYAFFKDQIYLDPFFNVELFINSMGEVNVSIFINKEVDINSIWNREWFNRISLKNYIEENKEFLLKKLYVNVNELDELLKNILKGKLDYQHMKLTRNIMR